MVWGEEVEVVSEEDEGTSRNGVNVRFKRGGSVERYDLLAAADGIGSQIRDSIFSAQIKDEGVHLAYFTAKTDLLAGSTYAQGLNATRGRTIYIRPDPNPAGHCSVILLNATWPRQIEERRRLNDALAAGKESYKRLLEEEFSDVGWLAPEALKEMRATDDLYCSVIAQVRASKLFEKRVVLLGDAGYATPGLGTSLAIMGGYVLAGELCRNGADIERSLQKYEDVMLPFVKSQQGEGGLMQLASPQTAWGIGVLRMVVRVVTGLRLDKLAMSVSGLMGWEKKLELPEYEWPEGLAWPEVEAEARSGSVNRKR